MYHENEEITAHNRGLLSRVREFEAGGAGGDVPMSGAGAGCDQRPIPSRSSEALIAEKNEQLDRLKKQASDAGRYIEQLSRELADKTQQLNMLSSRDKQLQIPPEVEAELRNLRGQLVEATKEVERLQAELAETKRSIEPKRNTLKEKEEEIKRLNLQCLDAQYVFVSINYSVQFYSYKVFSHCVDMKHLWPLHARRTRTWRCCR